MYYSEQIEAYLRNELSVEDKVIFEEMIRRDPLLKNELELQHDIVDVIRHYRKNQLKARLNQVPMDVATTGRSYGYKAAGVALAGLLLVGSLGWLAYDRFAPAHQPEPVTPNKSQQTDMPDSIFGNPSENKTVPATPEVKDQRTPSKDLAPKIQPAVKNTNVPKPEVTVPEDGQNTENTLTKTQEDSRVPSGDITLSPVGKNPKSVQVSIISQDPKHQFHYNFSEGKLVLYGRFEQLYEILDFNSKAGKQVYLYYQQNFYRLNENQVSTAPLQKVNNPQLIQTLKEAREQNK